MTAISYAAIFAEDLSLNNSQRENLGYTTGISEIAELVGITIEAQRRLAQSNGREFWPVPAAEAAADHLNHAHPLLPREVVIAGALHAAIITGFTEGK